MDTVPEALGVSGVSGSAITDVSAFPTIEVVSENNLAVENSATGTGYIDLGTDAGEVDKAENLVSIVSAATITAGIGAPAANVATKTALPELLTVKEAGTVDTDTLVRTELTAAAEVTSSADAASATICGEMQTNAPGGDDEEYVELIEIPELENIEESNDQLVAGNFKTVGGRVGNKRRRSPSVSVKKAKNAKKDEQKMQSPSSSQWPKRKAKTGAGNQLAVITSEAIDYSDSDDEVLAVKQRRKRKKLAGGDSIKRLEDEYDADRIPMTHEKIDEEWSEAETDKLIDALESMRKKGQCLGLYGLSDVQAKFINAHFLPNKTAKQIKSVVYANINEHVLTTNDEPLEAWTELFEYLYTPDALQKSKEALNEYLMDRANHHRLKNTKKCEPMEGVIEPKLEEIYSFMSAMLMKKDVPKLSESNAVVLLNALENIEKQAEIVSSKELNDLLISRYSALLLNRRSIKNLTEDRKHFTEDNANFDPNNPLALDLLEWKNRFQKELLSGPHRDLVFGQFINMDLINF